MIEESKKRNLDAIHVGKVSVASSPDEKTQEEQKDLEAESKKLDLEGKRQDIEARKSYANKIFTLVCGWLFAMILLVALSGFGTRLMSQKKNWSHSSREMSSSSVVSHA